MTYYDDEDDKPKKKVPKKVYVIINDERQMALSQIRDILSAERLKRERRTGLTEFVRQLQEQL